MAARGSEERSSAETERLGMRARPAVRPASGRTCCLRSVLVLKCDLSNMYSPAEAAGRKPLECEVARVGRMAAKAELCVVVQSHRAYFPDGLVPVPVAAVPPAGDGCLHG
jgi:hypothetical protein